MHELIPLPLHETLHRDTRSSSNNACDIVRGDPVVHHQQRRLEILLRPRVFGQLAFQIRDSRESQTAGAFVLALSLCDLELVFGIFEFFFKGFGAVEASAFCIFHFVRPRSKRTGRGGSVPACQISVSACAFSFVASKSFSILALRLALNTSVSFFRLSSSICMRTISRSRASSWSGLDSCARRSEEAASSTRSMDLSGRKRSAMYRAPYTAATNKSAPSSHNQR
jgi:hypothetical protein